jgi:hypothetical protein
LEYFDKLSDVLVDEKANGKIPFLMAGLKGRLLKKFTENCELAGGIHYLSIALILATRMAVV